MRISIISIDNGVGLTRDTAILTSLLREEGHEVWFTDYRSRRVVQADINLHLEVIGISSIPYGGMNILIPNPEWFDLGFRPYISRMDAIFCKTHDAVRIFNRLHSNVTYIGFTSIDRYLPVEKKKKFCHFAGKSTTKGTKAVIEASKLSGIDIDVYRYTLTDTELQQLQNEYMIHVCPSAYEGFGHYINEAKSCGAVIITTNHPPMNELVNSNFGFGVAVNNIRPMSLAIVADVDTFALADTLRMANELPLETLTKIGLRARESYLYTDKLFKQNLNRCLRNLHIVV
jgi:glycosyltransferase involved in cell wall biosynthesis